MAVTGEPGVAGAASGRDRGQLPGGTVVVAGSAFGFRLFIPRWILVAPASEDIEVVA